MLVILLAQRAVSDAPKANNPDLLPESRLSAPIIKFVGEPKDLAGKWMITVTLNDNRRNVRLPLKTSFTLK